MKKILAIAIMALTINAFAQQTPKTYNGPYSIGNNDGTATYTYIEQNGERIIDGNFSFTCPVENITVAGKYVKGKKSGLWTRKQLYSMYNGMPVKKTELKWPKVTESYPFKEITDITTENWANDALNGLSTSTKTVKNSWGYPAPGSASTSVFTVKTIYANGSLVSIDANRKENEKVNISFKGSYKNDFANGNWQFNDGKNLYNYSFNNGYLTSYEIKQQGNGAIIESNKINIDTVLLNSYYSKSDNSFDVKYGRSYSERKNAKLFVQKVNENLSIIKLCYQETNPANFNGLDVRIFTGAFGDITSYKADHNECLAYSTEIKCEVISQDKDLFYKINFANKTDEFKFLSMVNSKEGKFLNKDWTKYDPSSYMYQLKSFLYANNVDGLQKIKEIQDNGWNVSEENYSYEKSMNDLVFFDFWKLIKFIVLKDEAQWKGIINQYFNSYIDNVAWQSYLLAQLEELKITTIDQSNFESVKKYLTSKESEISTFNSKSIENIKEIKIGNQTWMANDLNVIPSNFNYVIVNDKKIQNYKVGEGIILYSISNEATSLCPKGWRIPTKTDWDVLITSLGGDKKAAGDLLKTGKGSGFESTFPIIVFQGWEYNKKLTFNSIKSGAYLFFDSEKKEIKPFMFGYEYELLYYPNKAYLPCRCIKE